MRFWDLEPRDIYAAAAGLQQRIASEWERAAQIAAWIAQSNGSKVTADTLLGSAFKRKRRKPSGEPDEE